ncbi:hypothetical protein J2S43_002245 [Catenuloplanes nepalensis]|uniref:C2H2-type domain-containing protein n=1 Tax=Catenuloplanes nepalensis TaxID=587533 RepID=A0ABT9MQN0_9ACTN|nr:hypothetical protein [Catenuloplanes nepalensis]
MPSRESVVRAGGWDVAIFRAGSARLPRAGRVSSRFPARKGLGNRVSPRGAGDRGGPAGVARTWAGRFGTRRQESVVDSSQVALGTGRWRSSLSAPSWPETQDEDRGVPHVVLTTWGTPRSRLRLTGSVSGSRRVALRGWVALRGGVGRRAGSIGRPPTRRAGRPPAADRCRAPVVAGAPPCTFIGGRPTNDAASAVGASRDAPATRRVRAGTTARDEHPSATRGEALGTLEKAQWTACRPCCRATGDALASTRIHQHTHGGR